VSGFKSFEEWRAAMPVPTSPEASALVSEAREMRALLDRMIQEAQAVRENAAAQVAAASTLEAEAAAMTATLGGIEELVPFGVDPQVLVTLTAKAAGMRTLAQELRGDPGVRAYIELQAAEESRQQQAAEEARRRLNGVLGQARGLTRQGDHEKAAALIGEIMAAALSEGLAAEFETPTAELKSIVAQAQAAVKAREQAQAEEQARKAFGRWRNQVAEKADWSQGDVVVTLALGQALYLRPRLTRRGNVEWAVRGYVGPADQKPKAEVLSSLSSRARVWDWRRQAPDAAKTLAEAEKRARAYAAATQSSEATSARPTKPAKVVQFPQPAGTRPARRDKALKVAEAPATYSTTPAPVGEMAEPPAGAQQDAVTETPNDEAIDLDDALAAAIREAAQANPDSPVAALVAEALSEPAPVEESLVSAAEEPHLVVFEAEDAMTATYWANAVAEILREMGYDAIGAQVAADTPQIAVCGMALDDEDELEVAVTVNGHILPTPQTFASKSAVKAQARREANVTASLRRQLARALPSAS